MIKRLFVTLTTALITLSVFTASLSSCTSSPKNNDTSENSSSAVATDSKATADDTNVETEGKTEKPVESESETEKTVETEGEPEEEIEIKTVGDAELFIKNMLSKASIDSSHYEIENQDADEWYSSNFTIKEKFEPIYSKNSTVHLLSSDTFKIAGDTDLRLGMKIEELVKQGWAFKYTEVESYEVPSNNEGSGQFIKGVDEVNIGIRNIEKEKIEYKDGIVGSVVFKQYSLDYDNNIYRKLKYATKFVLDNKISDESSISDVLQAFGAPYSIDYFIDPDFKELSTVEVSYQDRGAGLGDSFEFINFTFSR